MAFISEASNLVSGDTNGVADAFVRDLRSGTIKRVSADSRGKQANARRPWTSRSTAAAHAWRSPAPPPTSRSPRPRTPTLKSLVTKRPAAGIGQVYVKVLEGDPKDKGLVGVTFLASAQNGRPGNGNSGQPYFAKTGKAVVYSTAATNLHPRDTAPPPPTSTCASSTGSSRSSRSGCARGSGQSAAPRFAARRPCLPSTTARVEGPGGMGNGNSTSPSVTDDLLYVAYETLATDLTPADTNGFSDIMRARMDSDHAQAGARVAHPRRPGQRAIRRTP